MAKAISDVAWATNGKTQMGSSGDGHVVLIQGPASLQRSTRRAVPGGAGFVGRVVPPLRPQMRQPVTVCNPGLRELQVSGCNPNFTELKH